MQDNIDIDKTPSGFNIVVKVPLETIPERIQVEYKRLKGLNEEVANGMMEEALLTMAKSVLLHELDLINKLKDAEERIKELQARLGRPSRFRGM